MLDLSLKFSVPDMFSSGAFDVSSEMGRLTGMTFGGVDIIGTDSIRIVPGKLAAVPEPSTFVLAALGLLVLLLARRMA